MITTSEAAERLEVSRSRVLELIKNGQLDAEKHSGVWFVDESSVEKRVRSVRKKGGRPPRGSGNDEVSFTLMNRTHELSEIVYNRKLREFTFVDGIADEQRAPIGLANASGSIPPIDFNNWWRNRGIPGARIGVQELLRQAGVDVPEELLMRNLGLSLSDQYWIRPKQSGLHWEDVNFFNNDFDEVDERTDGFVESVKTAHAHPDNTSDGNLEKCWVVRNGVRMLRKGSRYNGQEPYNEVVATMLHGRLLSEGEYVPYVLDGAGSSAWSLCSDFLTDEEEYVPAMYVMRLRDQLGHENDFDHYVSCCEQLGARQARESFWNAARPLCSIRDRACGAMSISPSFPRASTVSRASSLRAIRLVSSCSSKISLGSMPVGWTDSSMRRSKRLRQTTCLKSVCHTYEPLFRDASSASSTLLNGRKRHVIWQVGSLQPPGFMP